MLLYLFDLGSDIYVAVQYQKNGDTSWFIATVILIAVPSFIVNVVAIIPHWSNVWTWIVASLQLSIFARYFKALLSDSGDLLIAQLRYLETITESAPQWCLQIYIMIRQWSFPWYTVTSSVLSFLSLAWSITTLEKERRADEGDDFGLVATVVFMIWQLFTLISRLPLIILFIYVCIFYYSSIRYMIIFFQMHCALVAVLMIVTKKIINGHVRRTEEILAAMAAQPTLFHSSQNTISTGTDMIVGYIIIIVENIIMVILISTDVFILSFIPHIDILEPIAIFCTAGGSFLSLICFFCYHCCGLSFLEQ